MPLLSRALVLGVLLLAACDGGTSGTAGSGGQGGGSGGSTGGAGGRLIFGGNGGFAQGLDVQPAALQTLVVPLGTQAPTVSYTATLDGQPVAAGWSVDKGEIGTVTPGPSSMATFTPSGATGG